MRNKNVYLDTIRWMLLPILFNVVCEVLKISVMFITAYYLGSVTDAALSGNYNLFFKVGKNLLIFMGISVVCIPILSIIMDFIWIKAGTISDIEMCSKISFWKYDKLKKFEEGEIEYKLSQELCEFRIYFANIFSNILLIPFFVAFLFYCINQLGAIYTVLGICCSLLTLLIPIIFRKVNFKYERENWQYNSEQNQILIQISEYAKAIKNFGLCDFFVERWKKLFTQYFVESRKKAIKIKNFVDEMNGFVKGVAQIAILLLGCILVDKKYITTGCIIMMLRYLSIYEIFFSRCI